MARLEDLKKALTGRYEIDREIGQGGMATVYLADDVRHARKVAVKVLRPDLATALGPERFIREIRIAANLSHPHILPLYDSGEADGFLYYVMPFIEGDTLRSRLEREGELPINEAMRIIREIVDALAFAHSKGVVHRDIKPDNVMLTGKHAVVTDFGVAKAVSEATGRDKLTTAGVALGTPAYMAPEQATADPHIDHRADIYAVGALAFELLSGRTPFMGATPQAILAAHVTEPAEPVSKYRSQVSAELDQVILKCLEKRPADRWQTAEELLPHLESASTPSAGLTPTDTRPISAVSQPASRSFGKLWTGVIGVAVMAAAAFGWFVTTAGGPAGVDRIAVVPFVDASGQDGEFLEAMHNSLISALTRIDGATVVNRQAVEAYRDERPSDREIAAQLGIGGIIDAQVFRIGQRARLTVQFSRAQTSDLLWAETYDIQGEDMFAVQDSIVRLVAREVATTLGSSDTNRESE